MTKHVVKYLSICMCAFLFLVNFMPAKVFAAPSLPVDQQVVILQDDDGNDHSEDTHSEDTTSEKDGHEAETTSMTVEGNAGAGIALGIIFLVLAIIFVVAIIATAGLGVIGLGAWQANSED